ncbi:Putative alpha-L-fucosidase [Strongyloides ratti]|uniref:Putative alpha-L-fucosidase n=1 Tax=Strongyloides ratti TaxID=34506 RepID=A0A090KWK2_STRRB|nr:Putative alpha-L-fucosidase [Strongyloides ratti]CEF61890.1 Putative alpha-L-fucosidase [Strongyloides ratti]
MIFLYIFLLIDLIISQYEPNWESLDSRPLPSWYDESKFGIFMHWGVYSVPAYQSEWLWYHWKDITYFDFGKSFTAKNFNPTNFASIVKSSGAKYFVFTSKHHEGFTMWPSKTSFGWNSFDIGPKRDIVKELKEAMENENITFGLYFSLMDWFHPLFLEDLKLNTTFFVDQISYPQLLEITNNYKPKIIWSDGEWSKDDEYWKSKEFLAYLYNESPIKDDVIVNDRWGAGDIGHHGGFMTYSDNYDPGFLIKKKWENCMTLDKKSWGYRRDIDSKDVHTIEEIIDSFVRTISCGGNFLLNIGPDSNGRISPIFEERLRNLGKWVHTNEEAIFNTTPWIYQNDSSDHSIWYTLKKLPSPRMMYFRNQNVNTIFAFILQIPNNMILHLKSFNVKNIKSLQISILGFPKFNPKIFKKSSTNGIFVDIHSLNCNFLIKSRGKIVVKIKF